jgi:hypothetical protein
MIDLLSRRPHPVRSAETALPPRARIGLAETVFLEFEQVGQ